MYAHSVPIAARPTALSHSHPQSRGAHHHAQTAIGNAAHHNPDIIAATIASGTPSIDSRARERREAPAFNMRNRATSTAPRST
jgi:hypothetical protein